MSSEERMSIDERRKYLKLVAPRYVKARRKERSALLSEMAAVTHLHRKSLIRLLRGPTLERAVRKPKVRRKRYGAAVSDVVRVVWESLDYICAERLTPVLLSTAQHLARWNEVTMTPEVEAALACISRATVQRMVQRYRVDSPKLPRRKPQPPNRLLRAVPMERVPWQTDVPGSFEADLVHHCGPVAAGEYVHTLQLVDVATGWSERVAILGRSQTAMVDGFERIRKRLPFSITHLHPDNGSEFFNDHLVRYYGEGVMGLELSRSRPMHKNDNRIVEQKNSTLVRAYVGYDRLDNAVQCTALNALYDRLWVYYNLFQPVLHLIGKEVLNGKLRRRWDTPRTPCQRLMNSGMLDPQHEAALVALYAGTNPRQLRRTIYEALERLWQQPRPTGQITGKEAALSR